MRKQPFSFEIEKLLPFCGLLRTSYVRDRNAFIEFSPVYQDGHLEELDNRAKLVDDCINPKSLTVRMKNNTDLQRKQFELALTYLDKIERYVDMAGKNVSVTKKDLEISALREHCHGHNAASVSEGLKKVKKLLAPYLAILEPLGYSTDVQSGLDTLIATVSSNKTEYNGLLNERMQLVNDNIGLLKNLWDYMNDILKTGKTIYKQDSIKIKEYTQTDILDRIERDIQDLKDKGNNGTTGTTGK